MINVEINKNFTENKANALYVIKLKKGLKKAL